MVAPRTSHDAGSQALLLLGSRHRGRSPPGSSARRPSSASRWLPSQAGLPRASAAGRPRQAGGASRTRTWTTCVPGSAAWSRHLSTCRLARRPGAHSSSAELPALCRGPLAAISNWWVQGRSCSITSGGTVRRERQRHRAQPPRPCRLPQAEFFEAAAGNPRPQPASSTGTAEAVPFIMQKLPLPDADQTKFTDRYQLGHSRNVK